MSTDLSELTGDELRDRTREWLADHLPTGWMDAIDTGDSAKSAALRADLDYAAWCTAFGESGFATPTWPAEYGAGSSLSPVQARAVNEVVNRYRAPRPTNIIGIGMGGPTVIAWGDEDLKQRFLRGIATNEEIWCQLFSEPGAGSDVAGLATRAERDGDEWVVNGTKNWITNLGVADFYVVFAKTDPSAPRSRGISAFVVEADRPGFSVGKLEHKLGIKGSPTGQPIFEDVRIPAANLIGEENKGMNVALGTLDHSRLGVAAQAVGIAQGATDHAVAYANERRQFGQAISEFQGIQFKLADMETRTAAARELLYRACAKSDRHEPDRGKYSAMAKLFASDTAMAVTVEAVQVLGGYGYVTEYPVERYMRDAKITQIYEGTNEIQRLVIARTLR
jgi:alkylation response protein AidB-like acyl-CoA dehydrogenase